MDKLEKYISFMEKSENKKLYNSSELEEFTKETLKHKAEMSFFKITCPVFILLILNISGGIVLETVTFSNVSYYLSLALLLFLNILIPFLTRKKIIIEENDCLLLDKNIMKDLTFLFFILWIFIILDVLFPFILSSIIFLCVSFLLVCSLSSSILDFKLLKKDPYKENKEIKKCLNEKERLENEIMNDKDCLAHVLEKALNCSKFKNSFAYKELFENKIEKLYFSSKESILIMHLKNNTSELRNHIEND